MRQEDSTLTDREIMGRVNEWLSHLWMVRTFLKHCDEAQEDDELMEIPRELYDYMLALGPAWSQQNAAEYLKLARKKWAKLKRAAEQFRSLQPEISNHTNFEMAALSLSVTVREIGALLQRSPVAEQAANSDRTARSDSIADSDRSTSLDPSAQSE